MMRKILLILSLATSGFILGGCCDEDFIIPDYNFFEYALDVTPILLGENCSDNEAFSTIGATGDGATGSCGPGLQPIRNRWFKFNAQQFGNIYIEIHVGFDGIELGTQRRTYITLWDTDGTTQLDCAEYYGSDDTVYLSYGGLIEGETYYFSVDVESPEDAGTFTLCIYENS